MNVICNSCLDFNCEGDCLMPDVPTQKIVGISGEAVAYTIRAVPIRKKCEHCYRVTDGKCSQCQAPLCAICAWPTRTPHYKSELDLCRPCRDESLKVSKSE